MVFMAPSISSMVNVTHMKPNGIMSTWTDAVHQRDGVKRSAVVEAARELCEEFMDGSGLYRLDKNKTFPGTLSMIVVRDGGAPKGTPVDLVWASGTANDVSLRPGIAWMEVQCLMAGLGKYLESGKYEEAMTEWVRFSISITGGMGDRNTVVAQEHKRISSMKGIIRALQKLIQKCDGCMEMDANVSAMKQLIKEESANQNDVVDNTRSWVAFEAKYRAELQQLKLQLEEQEPEDAEKDFMKRAAIDDPNDAILTRAQELLSLATLRKAAKAEAMARDEEIRLKKQLEDDARLAKEAAAVAAKAVIDAAAAKAAANAETKRTGNAAAAKTLKDAQDAQETALETQRVAKELQQKQDETQARLDEARREDERLKKELQDKQDIENLRIKKLDDAKKLKECHDMIAPGLAVMLSREETITSTVNNMASRILKETSADKQQRFIDRVKGQTDANMEELKTCQPVAEDCDMMKWNIKLDKHANLCAEIGRDLTSLNETFLNAVRIFVCVQPILKGQTKPADANKLSMTVTGKIGSKYFELLKGEETTGPFYDVIEMPNTESNPESPEAGILYQKMSPMVDQITKGFQLILFGYGYSGSGKTYNLLYPCKAPNVGGLAQQIINRFDKERSKVELYEVFELCFESITAASGSGLSSVTGYVRGSRKHTTREVPNTKVKEMTEVTVVQEYDQMVYNFNTSKDIAVVKFDGLLAAIEKFRSPEPEAAAAADLNATYVDLLKRTIRPTSNNPSSSRSHLFIVLKITTNDVPGYLTICDMGGRENPIEIYHTSTVGSFVQRPQSAVLVPSKTKVRAICRVDLGMLLTTKAKTFNGKGSTYELIKIAADQKLRPSLKTTLDVGLVLPPTDSRYKVGLVSCSDLSDPDGARMTDKIPTYLLDEQLIAFQHCICAINEGLYINESVNHFSYYIKTLNGKKQNTKLMGKVLNEAAYNTDGCFTAPTMDSDRSDLVKMISTMKYLTQLVEPECTNYSMLACIRSDRGKIVEGKGNVDAGEEFVEFSKLTLKFASSISSSITIGTDTTSD